MTLKASERLLSNSARIFSLWEQRSGREMSPASHQTAQSVKDALNDFLNHIAAALAKSDQPAAQDVARAKIKSLHFGRTHGSLRASLAGYLLSDTLAELQIL